LSRDEGESWDFDAKITLVAESTTTDCGYPSSVQLDDGRIFTSYYVYESPGPFRQGALRGQLMGPHAAGVMYREADLR
jgi:hypothetical protein